MWCKNIRLVCRRKELVWEIFNLVRIKKMAFNYTRKLDILQTSPSNANVDYSSHSSFLGFKKIWLKVLSTFSTGLSKRWGLFQIQKFLSHGSRPVHCRGRVSCSNTTMHRTTRGGVHCLTMEKGKTTGHQYHKIILINNLLICTASENTMPLYKPLCCWFKCNFLALDYKSPMPLGPIS